MDFKTRFQPFDASLKKTKKKAGQSMTFVEWVQYIIRAHTTDFPEGFSVEVRMVKEVGSNVVVVMRVIDAATGMFMDATGMAPTDKDKDNWGGAMAEAESQALRRAFAKWGMGLEMYLDEDETAAALDSMEPKPEPPTEQQMLRMKGLGMVLDELIESGDERAEKMKAGARAYVKKHGSTAETYDRLIPQLKKHMIESGFLPPAPENFEKIVEALDLEPTNAAAQYLINEQEKDHE